MRKAQCHGIIGLTFSFLDKIMAKIFLIFYNRVTAVNGIALCSEIAKRVDIIPQK